MKKWRRVINKRYSFSWFKSLYHSSRIVPSKRLRSLHIYIMIQSVQQMWNKIRSINFVGQQILTRVWFAKFDNSLLFLQAVSYINVYSCGFCWWWKKQNDIMWLFRERQKIRQLFKTKIWPHVELSTSRLSRL